MLKSPITSEGIVEWVNIVDGGTEVLAREALLLYRLQMVREEKYRLELLAGRVKEIPQKSPQSKKRGTKETLSTNSDHK
jgi:hypothetical protein